MAFADLLEAAFLVQFDLFHSEWVVKVRHVRVVERNVTIISNAHEAYIDRGGTKEISIMLALLPRVFRVPAEVMNFSRMNQVDQVGFHP